MNSQNQAQHLQNKIKELEQTIKDLENRIGNASILLADYDGYYDPQTKTGNARELASLIDDAYIILQNSHWSKRSFDPLPEEHHDIDD